MKAKNPFRMAVIITAAVAVAALGIAAVIGLSFGVTRGGRGAGAVTVDESRSFPAEGVTKISVSAVSERIRIIDSGDGQITARLSGTVRAGSRAAAPRLAAEAAAGVVAVKIQRRPAFVWSDLTLTVSVPRGWAGALAADAVSGEVEIADHAYGDALAVTTTSGKITLGSVAAAAITARSTSGEIKAAAVASPKATFTTVSGAVEVRSLTGGLTARSTSGEISVRFAAQPGAVDVSSTSGEVTLAFPSDAGFTLDARSTSGSITCDFPVTLKGGREHALSGAVGSGAAPVKVATTSGEIRITR
jgi:lia operon protein LiaG